MKPKFRQIGVTIGVFCVLLYVGRLVQAQQDVPYGGAHVLVQHTLDDLQHVQSTGNQNNKDRTRTDDAVKQLSGFDGRLAQRHFDKGTLDSAIKNVSAVAEKNHL